MDLRHCVRHLVRPIMCFALFTGVSLTASLTASADDQVVSVSVKIKEPIASSDREAKYDDPLDAALKAGKAGEVTGGGNSLDKQGKVEWAGVDVDINDIKTGIPLLKQKLLDLGAPKGSVLEYHDHGKKVVVPIQ